MNSIFEKEKIEIFTENGANKDEREVTIKLKLKSDQAKIAECDLGKKHQKCKICGAEGDFQMWRLTEMQYGTGDKFNYFECPECRCLQIEEFPKNIGDYYSNEYYSYAAPQMPGKNPGAPHDTRRILDVGCGSGQWLCSLVSIGCVNLFGCDPFIEKDLIYPNGVKIFKKSIHEMDGKYDIISFNDSLEHMPDQHEVFKTMDNLLRHKGKGYTNLYNENPKIEIILPLFPSLSWDIYGPYAFPLDTPRHFFLHSLKSLEYMAEKYGFYIKQIDWRPIYGHYVCSGGYQKEIPWNGFHQKFTDDEIYEDHKWTQDLYEGIARLACSADYGDHAHISLERKD